MFGSSKPKVVKSISSFNSLISAGTCVNGPLKATGALRINGEVIGRITKNQVANDKQKFIVLVERDGSVVGEISADNIIIAGTVDGNLSADTISISSTATVVGNIYYGMLHIEDGATVTGSLIKKLPATPGVVPKMPPVADIKERSAYQDEVVLDLMGKGQGSVQS
jgi:cytoskeletal protein CcmA (bactofilin family)